MNVYDFDGTIYDGDSTVDFYFFCMKHQIKILRALPEQVSGAIRYVFHKIDKTTFKEHFYSFLKYTDDVDQMIDHFWKEHHRKIKACYLKRKKASDVIISASPAFLLSPICTQLNVQDLIASEVDPKTGRALSPNCRGEEKLKRFQAKYADASIDVFYSDNQSDLPLAMIAQKSYLIKGEQCHVWKK